MDITKLLQESFQPEQATLVENAITQVIEQKLTEAKSDAASAQAQIAQASADKIDNITAHYEAELKKAAGKIIDLEKFYNKQINIAVDKITQAYDEKDRLTEHFEGEIHAAAAKLIEATDEGSLAEAQDQIAKYVTENASLAEQATAYGKYAYEQGLAEAQSLVEEATQAFIAENQERFERLDEMARLEKIVGSIREAYEQNALGLSEDEAYKGLQEEVSAKDKELEALRESVDQVQAQLFESQKEKAFEEATKTLSENQKDKVREISKAILAEDVGSYTRTLGILIESQTQKSEPAKQEPTHMEFSQPKPLTEAVKTANEQETSDYVNQLVSKMF